MKRFAAIVMGAMIGLAGGLAQAQTSAPAAPPAAAVASKATPATRALAERYFEAVHYDQLLSQMMKSMMPAMVDAMRKQSPSVTEAQGKIISDVALESSLEMVRRMKAPMLDAVAEVFTEQELRDLVAFYEAPTGQALLAKSPELTQRMMQQMPTIMGDMQTEMRAKLCAKLDCGKAATPANKASKS